MRSVRTFCSLWRGESVTSPGYNGSVCQPLTLSCLLSLVVELLERYIVLQGMIPCACQIQSNIKHMFTFMYQALHLRQSRLCPFDATLAGQTLQAENQRQGVCHEEAEESRNGQAWTGQHFACIDCVCIQRLTAI